MAEGQNHLSKTSAGEQHLSSERREDNTGERSLDEGRARAGRNDLGRSSCSTVQHPKRSNDELQSIRDVRGNSVAHEAKEMSARSLRGDDPEDCPA